MDEERLIALVQEHECLYNLQHKDYDNNLVKDNVWKQIAGEVHAEVEECKSTWKNLRAYYRKALRRRESTSGQASKQIKKWRFEKQMSFLQKHFQERETYTNIENGEEATEDLNDDDDDDNSNTRETHTPSPSVSASSTDSKRKRSNTSDLCETLTRFIASRDKSYREGTTKKKQLAIFFEDIAETMIKFPEVDQAEIKSEIFNLVNKKEIELLRQKQSVPHQNQQNILSPALYHSQYSPKAFFPTEPPTTSQSSHGYFSQAFSHVPTNLSLNHPNSLYPPAE